MSQAQIANLNVALGINTAQFANGLAQAQSSLASFGKALKTFAAGASVMEVFNSAVAALHNVADLGDVAESIGVTAEQLQVYQKMALASGTSTDVLTRGLQSLAEQSVQSGSALNKLFDANGLTTKGQSVNDIIRQFMELVKNAQSPAQQLAIITSVLGDKVGRQLVEAFRDGADGVDASYARMLQSGLYLSNETVKAGQDIETAYNEIMANIATAWQGMVVELVRETQQLATMSVQNPKYLPGGGRAGPIRNPNYREPGRNSGMGSAGGPNEFSSPPVNVKVTVLPPTKDNTDNVKKTIAESVKPNPIVPDIDTSAWDQAQQVVENTYTPLEQYRSSLRNLNDVYNSGAITSDVYQKSVQKLQDQFTGAVPAAQEFNNTLLSIGETITDNLGFAISGLITGTTSLKDAFSSMTQSVAQQLSQIAAQLIKSSLLKVLSMFAGSMGGFSFGGMSFGGFYADGGTLGSGKWGIAGEAGPEIIHGPASITPMSKSGGQAAPMNVTVINNSSASVSAKKQPDGSLRVFVEETMADLMLRGGNKVDAALARGYGLRRAGR